MNHPRLFTELFSKDFCYWPSVTQEHSRTTCLTYRMHYGDMQSFYFLRIPKLESNTLQIIGMQFRWRFLRTSMPSWLVLANTSCYLHTILQVLALLVLHVRESTYRYSIRLPAIDQLAVIDQVRVTNTGFVELLLALSTLVLLGCSISKSGVDPIDCLP